MLVNVKFSSGFTAIPNSTARDTSIHLMARAILLYIRSLPDDWKIHPDQVAKANGISRNTFDKYLAQLRKAGYVEYERFRNPETNKYEKRKNPETGVWESGQYIVYPIPKQKIKAGSAIATTKLKRTNKAKTIAPKSDKSNYLEKLKHPKWQKKRLEILERDDWKCVECGEDEKMLQVHHIRYGKGDPWDVPNWYLVTLCDGCHSHEHKGPEASQKEVA